MSFGVTFVVQVSPASKVVPLTSVNTVPWG